MKSNKKNRRFLSKSPGSAHPRPGRSSKARLAASDLNSLNILCAHAARTLPDSLAGRKQLLAALANVMRLRHPATRQVRAQMIVLHGFEAMQAGLAREFERLGRPTPKPHE